MSLNVACRGPGWRHGRDSSEIILSMGRKAKPLQEQVELLRKRGMSVDDPERARELLLEIGWYRLSLYWFPFETRYPDRMSDTHRFREGTKFRDAMFLYAFDFNLRTTLIKYLERIETAFRTYMIHIVSTRYPESPTWFADPNVVRREDAHSFERAIYYPLKRQSAEIILHHRRFPRDKFAPAWKTLEFVTLGTMVNLFDSLRSTGLRQAIASHFGIHDERVFRNYMEIIRSLRNICAHGNVLYSFRPAEILNGPALKGTAVPKKNLFGALAVVEYLTGIVSPRLREGLRKDISGLLNEFCVCGGTRHVLFNISGASRINMA